MITLMSATRCPYCVRTRLVLAEKGIEYELEEIDLSNRPPILRARNPRNKVPVLIHDDLVLPESAVINEYLDEVFPDPPMMPDGPAERAGPPRRFARWKQLAAGHKSW